MKKFSISGQSIELSASQSLCAIALAALSTAMFGIPTPASAHTPTDALHQLLAEGNLQLKNGEKIRDFSLMYTPHGTLNADRSNAILLATAIGGNHHRPDHLIGSDRALDPQKSQDRSVSKQSADEVGTDHA